MIFVFSLRLSNLKRHTTVFAVDCFFWQCRDNPFYNWSNRQSGSLHTYFKSFSVLLSKISSWSPYWWDLYICNLYSLIPWPIFLDFITSSPNIMSFVVTIRTVKEHLPDSKGESESKTTLCWILQTWRCQLPKTQWPLTIKGQDWTIALLCQLQVTSDGQIPTDGYQNIANNPQECQACLLHCLHCNPKQQLLKQMRGNTATYKTKQQTLPS